VIFMAIGGLLLRDTLDEHDSDTPDGTNKARR
jgi:hypothetical protein